MKTLYLVKRKLTSEEEQFVSKHQQEEDCIIYYEKPGFLSSRVIENKNSYLLDIGNMAYQLNEEHLARVASLGKVKVNKKTLHEHLQSKDNSFWFYLKFSVFHRSIGDIHDITVIRKLKQENPNYKIVIFSDKEVIDAYFDFPVKQLIKKTKRNKTLKIKYLFNFSILFFLRAICGLFLFPIRKTKRNANIILTNPYNHQQVLSRNAKQFIQSDPHLGYLIEESRNDCSFLLLSQLRAINLSQDFPFKPLNYFRYTKDSKRTIFFEPFLFLVLFSPKTHKRFKILKHQLAVFKSEVKHSKFGDDFLKHSIETCTNSSRMLFQAIWREEAAKLFLKFQGCRSFTLIDEHSLKNRSIWFPLKKAGVNIVAIQHGAISRGNIAYRFHNCDFPYSPLPNLTLIRGRFTHNMLSNDSIYKQNDLQIVGHMRTDVIPNLKKEREKAKNRTFKILFATQPMQKSDRELRLQQYDDFFETCLKLKDYTFIIKPHPSEFKAKEFYQSMAKKKGVTNVTISSKDLYFQLADVDLVITYFSTVGIEAIYFDKDLITLDYLHLDFQSYLKNKVCYNVHNAKELTQAILELKQKKTIIPTAKKISFIEDRAFKIDGKSTQRHLNAITN